MPNRKETANVFDDLLEEEDAGTAQQPRLSFYFDSTAIKQNRNKEKVLEEIDRVEQLITLNLQRINENLITSNNIISNKLIPTIESFNKNSNKIHNNINHIKEFYENAANVNILTKKDVEFQEGIDSRYMNDLNHLSTSFEQYDQKFTSDDANTSNTSFHKVNSDTSEFKVINARYKNNLEFANTSTSEIRKPRSGDDPTTSTFMKDFQTNIDDESTSKQPILNNSLTNLTDKLQRETEDVVLKEKKEKDENPTSKFVKDMMNGYESPPWEEPPELQSSKIGSNNIKHSKKRQRSNSLNPDTLNTDLAIETDEDVSIRFPQSPKYGAGGKLLRSEKGRQLALDYAKSEMMQNHPILLLQSDSHREMANTSLSGDDNAIDMTENDSSSFEEAPALLSEQL